VLVLESLQLLPMVMIVHCPLARLLVTYHTDTYTPKKISNTVTTLAMINTTSPTHMVVVLHKMHTISNTLARLLEAMLSKVENMMIATMIAANATHVATMNAVMVAATIGETIPVQTRAPTLKTITASVVVKKSATHLVPAASRPTESETNLALALRSATNSIFLSVAWDTVVLVLLLED